ncbi:uncharacterized protein PITG_10957 [Phytophthora infestans T30-4]|uniref:Uncharacterized protein n=1 Tax=Phytophthora infestans (strain T30-4) TaxID=403677 RepID=D0NFU5_PHYIT|nr:uncharacterized protein PITG_10957 [Phytophthora infestans T30-4]EEY57146.1 hypothetical protein PITG_10957 [Phytophthora infestans T30-4]|eukprot:XP_002901756.1 hypothetical protein PITG_10957 [Phytophthora infestans T30-4]
MMAIKIQLESEVETVSEMGTVSVMEKPGATSVKTLVRIECEASVESKVTMLGGFAYVYLEGDMIKTLERRATKMVFVVCRRDRKGYKQLDSQEDPHQRVLHQLMVHAVVVEHVYRHIRPVYLHILSVLGRQRRLHRSTQV